MATKQELEAILARVAALEASNASLATEKALLQVENERLRQQGGPAPKPRINVGLSEAGNLTVYASPTKKGQPPLRLAITFADVKAELLHEVQQALVDYWHANSETTVAIPRSKQDATGKWYRDSGDVAAVTIPKFS